MTALMSSLLQGGGGGAQPEPNRATLDDSLLPPTPLPVVTTNPFHIIHREGKSHVDVLDRRQAAAGIWGQTEEEVVDSHENKLRMRRDVTAGRKIKYRSK